MKHTNFLQLTFIMLVSIFFFSCKGEDKSQIKNDIVQTEVSSSLTQSAVPHPRSIGVLHDIYNDTYGMDLYLKDHRLNPLRVSSIEHYSSGYAIVAVNDSLKVTVIIADSGYSKVKIEDATTMRFETMSANLADDSAFSISNESASVWMIPNVWYGHSASAETIFRIKQLNADLRNDEPSTPTMGWIGSRWSSERFNKVSGTVKRFEEGVNQYGEYLQASGYIYSSHQEYLIRWNGGEGEIKLLKNGGVKATYSIASIELNPNKPLVIELADGGFITFSYPVG